MERQVYLCHPGLILKDKVFKPNGLSVTDGAKLLEVSRPALSNVLNGRADISPVMSIRIEMVFGLSAIYWIHLQACYNLYVARKKAKYLKLKPFQNT